LGFESIVYAGAVIGSGSIVGASSVVAGKVPNNCIVVGNPARVIKKDIFWQFTEERFSE
jgi:acetyltransferase-like isoleucine patch superfamily enzyme